MRAGFPSPADDYLDAPIDLSRALIQDAPATFIMTVAGDSAIDVSIFDGSAPEEEAGSEMQQML